MKRMVNEGEHTRSALSVKNVACKGFEYIKQEKGERVLFETQTNRGQGMQETPRKNKIRTGFDKMTNKCYNSNNPYNKGEKIGGGNINAVV